MCGFKIENKYKLKHELDNDILIFFMKLTIK